jgi:tetratricopeptide (TPR) repeat protein
MNKKICSVILMCAVLGTLSTAPATAQQAPLPALDNPAFPVDKARHEQVTRSYAIVRQGQKLLRGGNPKAAIPLFQQALSLKESNSMAYIGLAEAYEALGDRQKSLSYYRKVMYTATGQRWVSSLPNDYEHLIKFAVSLRKAGEEREAQSVYQKATTVAPSGVAPYLYVPDGGHAFDRKKMAASLHLAASDLAEWQAHTGKKSERDANLAERLAQAKAAVATAPDHAPAHLMLGEALVFQSQYDSFHKRLEKARESKRQALQAYKRAASLGKGRTKAAAQKGMQSYWFDDIARTTP